MASWLSVFILALALWNSAGRIPVAGIPIQVIRTYDSRDKREGDFGVGWTLDIKNIRLQKNRNLGLNWRQDYTAGGFGSYCLTAPRPRVVTITFPDGKTQKFENGSVLDIDTLGCGVMQSRAHGAQSESGISRGGLPRDESRRPARAHFPG